ncbi:MAG: serine protease [Neolewinella sp.]|jgi:subtilisin family serine protease
MFYRLLVTTLLLTVIFPLSAQRLDYRQGELIVQFGADVDAKVWITAKSEITEWKPLGRALNAYLVSFDFSLHDEEQLRQEYWTDPAVAAVQLNHFVALRARPNDQRYDDQWHHFNVGQLGGPAGIDHNVEPAWDITTGGVTLNGDTIVVAILDDGIDTDHEDILPNLWVNRDEIPDNNVDDDNNGYVDDIHGFNTVGDDGNIEATAEDDHGTSVAGIIGAKGNNSIGVTGNNWDVKMMIIRNGFLNTESEILQAYSYALESRQRYDLTNGQEGAYVVVTNASWGRDFGDPDDSPIWCGLYDQLGAAGILNIGATINSNVDVDVEGDLPTQCPSNFLIAVTNINSRDIKVRGAGYGNKSIDLGAHGDDTFTTALENNYRYFCCTSAATPQVAGAAALLFSAPCDNFAQLMAVDPAAAALRVRAALLNTTSPNESLSGITVTEGKLNIGAAMESLMTNGAGLGGLTTSCSDCLPPFGLEVFTVPNSVNTFTINWRAVENLSAVTLRYRPENASEWVELTDITSPYELTGLPACNSYDFQIIANCNSGEVVSTRTIKATTDGCCVIPDDFNVTASQNQVFIASWSELLAGRSYRVRYRKLGDTTWLARTSISGSLGIAGGIEPCTNYEFEFQTNCDTLITDFGNRMTVLSTGCGACLERDYCIPGKYSNDREWIVKVNVGNILINNSGQEPEAYNNFGEITERPFVRGGEYPIELTPEFSVGTGVDGFRVYVDWNQDGNLTSNEIAAEMNNEPDGPARAVITVPEDAKLLLTRMRVMIQFLGVSSACPSVRKDGEVEDYCINIIDADPACPAPTRLDASYDAMTEQTLLAWRASAAAGGSYRLRYRLRDSQDEWIELDVDDIYLTLDDINLCGTYEVELASVCGGTPGEFRSFNFNDQCTGTRDNRLPASAWKVFPNPATGQTNVSWSANLRATSLQLFDVHGRVVSEVPANGVPTATVNLTGLAAGVYLLRLRMADGQVGVRRVVVR